MIDATLRLIPDSRSSERGDAWSAACEWNGQKFEAISRNGAHCALARELVAAGAPDQPMRVMDPGGGLRFTVRSIRVAARMTYEESANRPLQRATFRERPRDATAEGPKQGFPRVPATGVAPADTPPVWAEAHQDEAA